MLAFGALALQPVYLSSKKIQTIVIFKIKMGQLWEVYLLEIMSITLRSQMCLQKNQCCSSNYFIQIIDKILQYLLYHYKSLYVKSKFEYY